MPKKIWALALAGLQLTCHQAILTAPAGSSMILIVNPPFIAAFGGVSIVSAIVTEPAGTPVADGTVVQFFTTLGRIDEQGKTNDGVARVNLVADGRSGTANITAISGGPAAAPAPSTSPSPGASTPPGGSGGTGSATASVTIGNINAATVLVRADPPRITISRSTHMFATVRDSAGNPLAGAPVVFTVVGQPGTEFMDSAGRPIFTNNNGEAEDVLRTRRDNSGDATVRAIVPGPDGTLITGEIVVPIVF